MVCGVDAHLFIHPSIHPLVDEPLGCFHSQAAVSYTAVSSHVRGSFEHLLSALLDVAGGGPAGSQGHLCVPLSGEPVHCFPQ